MKLLLLLGVLSLAFLESVRDLRLLAGVVLWLNSAADEADVVHLGWRDELDLLPSDGQLAGLDAGGAHGCRLRARGRLGGLLVCVAARACLDPCGGARVRGGAALLLLF